MCRPLSQRLGQDDEDERRWQGLTLYPLAASVLCQDDEDERRWQGLTLYPLAASVLTVSGRRGRAEVAGTDAVPACCVSAECVRTTRTRGGGRD